MVFGPPKPQNKMDFLNFGILDAIDILIVAILMLQVYRMIRGTAALTIFAGVFVFYMVWVVVRVLNMELLSLILGQVIGVGVLALLIVFQQEVRRYLLMLGNRYAATNNKFISKLFRHKNESANSIGDQTTVRELTDACLNMARSKTGALIVVERKSNLDVYSSTGDIVDARLSARIIEAIFFKNSPMHDGAMIIRDTRVYAARCILPSSDNPHISAHLGMRHRAAIGVSEHSDALVIVVSEETGRISVVVSGVISTLHSVDDLYGHLTGA